VKKLGTAEREREQEGNIIRQYRREDGGQHNRSNNSNGE
jgi:hypothetical protein